MPPRRALSGRSQQPRSRYLEEVRSLRRAKDVSLRRLAESLGWDSSTLGKLETGKTLGGPELAQALDDYYGVHGALVALWELANADPAQFKERYRVFMALEAEATAIHKYSPCVVPGLLQAEPYARQVLALGGLLPGPDLDQQVEARTARHALLSGDTPPEFRAILDEAVLSRPLPDAAAWRAQLRHLLDTAEHPHVTVQVLPFSAGLREMSNTDTSFLRLPAGGTVAWVETGYNGELVQEIGEVEQLQVRYDRLRDHALTPRASADLISRILEAD